MEKRVAKFSIIVPVYNVERYLKKCVDSILAQTFTDFELILVDDGSPDSCPEICDSYAAGDDRVHVIHKKNGGLVAARNIGVQAAKGEYVCYVDGDDWVADNWLKIVWAKAIKDNQPDMVVYNAVKQYNDYQEKLMQAVPEGLYTKEKLQTEVYPYMMYDNRKPFCNGLIFPVAWNKVYKRDLLLAHYCTEEKIRMGEDNAFTFECIYAANTVYFCDDVLYFYNQQNTSSMVHSYDPLRFENNQYLTTYIQTRLGGIDRVLDEQINAFKAYWLIMAVFHEVKSGRTICASAAHIKEKIAQTKVLDQISMRGLPMMAKVYLLMLRLRLYHLTLIASAIVNKKRMKR